MAHTPGPWKVVGGTVIISNDGIFVAYTPEVAARFNQVREDARFIATAPDTLAKLEKLAEYAQTFYDFHTRSIDEFDALHPDVDHSSWCNLHDRFQERIFEARAAIAKAKGDDGQNG
jgi:hypothetical protein